MVRFRGHVVAALLLLSASVNAVPRPRTGGEGNDALAFIQHSLKSSSQAQLQTASLEAAPPKKAMTPEEKQKERQRKMKKIEREAKAKGCPPGHSLAAGDVPGGDQFGRDNKHKTDTIELCMEDCASKPLCVSFEWSPNSHVCNSNKEVPAKYGKPWQDFMLCVRNATQGPAAGSEPPLAMAAANESSAAAANETAAAANGAKAAEEAPAKQPAEAEAPAKQAAEPEAPVKQPAEAEAPAKQAAEPEAPLKQPAEVEAPAKQAAEPEAPAKQPAEAEAPAKQAVQPEAPAKQPAEAEAPAKQAPEPEAPAKQAAESEAPAKQAAEAEAPAKQAAESEAPAKQAAESEARAKDIAAVEEHTEVNRKSEEESERKSEEGARKAKEEADRVVEEEAERKAKELAEHKAQDEAMKAKEEADRLAKEEAERKAKEEAERKAKEEADRLAQEEAARKAKEEAERLEREEAERKAKEEAERLERQEAERKAEEEARKAKEEADRLEAERKAKEEAERQEAERKVEEEARKAKEEADRLAQEEAEREAKEEAERKAKEEAERKAKEEAERLEREEAERKAKEEAERLEAERKAKEEAERKAKEEAARLEAERKAKEAACVGGYVYVQGDVPGWDQFGHENVKKATARLCRKSCDAVEDCLSYEWSPTTKICSLNKDRQPTVDSFEDYIFCQRSEEYYQKWQEKQARLAKEKTEAADLARKESDEERRGLQELAESQARARLEREERKRAEEERKVAEAEAAEEAKRKEEEEARKREEFAVGMINIEDAAAEDEAEEKRKEEEARRQAEELARQQAEEAAAAERRAREAKEAEQEAERKAEEEARQLHEEEKQRQTDEEARLKAEEQAKELEIVEAVQRAQEQEEQTKAEEAESEKASEEAKRKAEEDAKRIAEEQKKAEEEERLLELEKTDPAAAALQRRKAMFKAKMAAALERKRLMAEKKRKKEEAVSDRLQAMDLEIKRKQREEEERRRREEEETRRKQEEEEAKRKAEEDAKAQEAAQLILKEQEERDRQTRAENRATEQKVSAASRSFLAASPTSDPARKNSVTLRVQDTHGKSMVLKVSRTTRLKVMMNTVCSRLGLLLADAQFTHGGRPVSPTDTTESFGLSDNDLITVDDFIKVDDLVEAEETKDEDPAAKAAREMFEAAQREWEGSKTQDDGVAELSSAEKAQVVVRNKEDAAKWQASAKAALQGLPAPRSAQDARNKAEKVVPLLKDTEIDGILFGSSSNPAGAYWGNSLNISRYDIPALRVQDSTFRFPKIIKSVQKTVTCWPSGLALASTWDEQLVGRVAGATAAEMRGKGANLMFAPSVAVVRVAASGRNFEQLSGEDPYLGARLAKSFVRATQKEGVMAAVRGFGFVHQETNRRVMDVKVDDKVAFELYYPPFEAAIQAGVAGVTCSPTKVNGTGGCEHPKLLKGDLKGTMQFPGFVVSEEPPYSGPSSIDRGLDVTMPSPQERKAWMPWGEASPQAKTEAATRLLTSIYRSRMDELPEWQASMALSAQSSEQRTQQNTDLAVQAATSAVTLLKNNGVLPLSPSSVKRIAVLGNAASARPQISFINADYYSGGGPAHVPAANGAEATPLEQIKRRAKAAQVAVETGPFNATPGQAKDVASMAGVDVVVVVAATTSAEGGDRTSLALDDSVDALIAAVAPVKPTVVLMQTPGAVLTPWRDDVAAAANLFLAGEATGKAWAAILFGDASPGGKLPLAMPRTEADVVRPTSSMKVHYSEGLHTSYRSNTFAAAFPFGHGLSYTDFAYGAPQVLAKGCLAKACVRLDVTNTGERPGSEVVQAYVQFGAAENMPRVLRSFHKTAVLKPGHAEEVFLMFTPRDLSTYHPETGWVEQTNVKVEIGSSSADVRQTIWVNVNVAVDVEPETS